MSVILTPKLEQFIREKVAAGGYRDEADVVADALYLLEQRDSDRRGALIGAVEEGEADIRAGRYLTLSTPEEIDAFFAAL
ncbi:MAG: type II toxin-antitoxin system ParD family antitoxin [Caulobacter sp.]|nr:type II toxin-antitoxin system ParD family antitoxin [Caulobacter sp.]